MRRERRVIFISAVLLLLAVVPALISQDSQIRARVDLVVVPVSVRDNNGSLITNLGPEDFTVLEDGRQQKITNFSVDAQPLSAAIVVDDGISGPALKQIFDLLPSIAGGFTVDDEMTSFRYDHLTTRLSDFTRDRQQIEKSFGDLEQIAKSRPDEPERPAVYDKIERKTPGIVRALAGIFSLGSNGAPSAVPTSAPAPRPAPASRTMHSAVYEAAMALEARPETFRKIIFLISDGVVSEPQTSFVPGKTLHSLDRNIELLLKDEIQVYSIHTLADLLEKPAGVLNAYASATGGSVYGGRSDSDMKFAFGRIPEQARTEYVLGYVSDNEAPTQGIYRKIEVRSGDRDLKRTVTHRQGYTQYPISK
jgi:VWFA-related protein